MDPVITGAAANVASEAAKGIFHEVKRHMRYVFIHKKNVDKFEEKLKSLIAKRASVQQEVDAANRNGEKIKADIEHWRKTVDKVIDEEDKRVKDLEEKAKNKCFIGLCPNIKSRYQLSRKAEDGAAAVDDLIGQCQFNGVGYLDVPEAIVDASPNGFETFKSREKVFNDIMEAMKDAAISMIGVYGMGGVGKTSLVNEVARQVQEVKLFDSVVTITVAQTPDIQKIQENIAELLGLRLEDKTIDARARRLHERLKKEKMVLVVLDDIWKKLDLREVGIPFGNQHKGCKILLTSRDQNVLSNEMDADKTFAIDDLDDEEAWDLFRKMAGADSVESSELRSTAIEVAKKCARLPLAIATVARALRNKGLFVWKDALRLLQKPSSRNFTGISADVYSAIELGYNHLENEELKQAFLLCSLVHRDASIDDLLKYAIGLGVIKGVDTMEEARNSLLTMVSKLKTSCLLLGSTNNEYFNVHDLVYDVAMLIASVDNYVFAPKEEDVLKDWPDEERMKKCNKIHLVFPSIRELPDELNCPQLVYLRVFSEDYFLKMPLNFLRKTTSLKVLHVTNMHVSSLSSSICLLKCLLTLCLDGCELGDIAIIGELKNLEILSFSNSDIRILPKEIGQLVKLKLLDLSYCTKLKIISPNVLSSLPKLEELYMTGTFIQWEVEGHANPRSNASLAELKKLTRLAALEVNILDVEAIQGACSLKSCKSWKDTRFS
ncbi:NB-ARC domain-containing disease resistance protein [Theobroma cacao]|uniref:NB-ARC domain-containing disease resistance protein n=1 Tax=Theobroma cacao TaxID=3641 RepID=S1SI74_THECC|nr:NB-ARC domain-containing disease resistance protein [Theobroma cacao]